MNILDIAIAKGYTEESLLGAGALKGQDGKDGADGKDAYKIAVEKGFEGTDEEWLESLKGADGKDGENGKDGVDGQNGKDGIDGYSPTIVENESNDSATYKLDITDKNGTFTTPNLIGQGGNGGSGDENVIESISVNGKEIKPDENKNVDIAIPTISSEIDNQIETKEDGIYVKDMSTKVSSEEGNALIFKDDGLYVPSVSGTKVSDESDNQIVSKEDGIYVAPTDLSKYAKTEDISIDRDLTMAEYQALSDEEKNNGTTYYITDVENLPSGVEIVTELNDTTTDKQVLSAKAVYDSLEDLIFTEIITLDSLTIPTNSEKSTTVNISKEGYKPIIATINSTGNAKCFCYALRVTELETLNAGFHNVHTTDLTISPQVQLVYRKDI